MRRGLHRARRRAFGAACAALAAACPTPQAPPAALAPAPRVELIGCEERRPGPVCEIVPETSALTLWVEGADKDGLRVAVDDREVSPGTPVRVQGGLRVRISPGPGGLTVTRPGRAPYRITLVPHAPQPGLARVASLRHAGDLDGAEAALTALVVTATVPGAWGQRARNLMARGRVEEARRAFSVSLERHRAAGRQKSLAYDYAALTFLNLSFGGSVADARAALDRLGALAQEDTWAAIKEDYYRITLAHRQRDPRAGLRHLRRAIAREGRLGRTRDLIDLRQYRVIMLRLVGRWAELRAELDRLRPHLDEALPACDRARLLTNLGWHELIGAQQAPALFAGRSAAELDEGAELYRTRCPRPDRRANAALNAGWAALLRGDADAARRHLDAARTATADFDATRRLHAQHLEAALFAHRRRHARAARAFTELAAAADAAQAVDIEWQAHLGRGRALEALGRRAAAVTAYQDAQDRLHVWATRVPLGEGRDALLHTRAESAEALVSALVALGRDDAAIRAIRRIRLGHAAWARQRQAWRAGAATPEVAALQAEVRAARRALDGALAAAWDAPGDALAEIRRANQRRLRQARDALDRLLRAPASLTLPALEVGEGEALVFAHPVAEGMVALVRTPARTTRVTAPATPAGLRALGPHLASARRARLYVSPELLSLPWDALPVEGAPLFRRAEVVFHADLGPAPARPASRSVLVVGDPAGDLPVARAEAERIARLYRRADRPVVELGTEPSIAAVSAALEAAPDMLHYCGHGVREGLDGLEGGLPLGGGRRFTVMDVLALSAVPRRAVLAACDLGARDTAAFSLAQAILLEGAEEVVAAIRPVDDRSTARWSEAVHGRLARGEDLAAAVRATRVELADAAPPVDASAFRLWRRR